MEFPTSKSSHFSSNFIFFSIFIKFSSIFSKFLQISSNFLKIPLIFPIKKVFYEQYILGFLCWTLDQIFPLVPELRKTKTSILLDDKSALNSLPISKSEKKYHQQDKILKKKIQEISQEKALLSEKIYVLLSSIGSNNAICAEYIGKFLPLFTKHIGFGDFVCKTLEEIIFSNEKSLEKITNLAVLNTNQSLFEGKFTKKTFIDEIFIKLKSFNSFEKVNLLSFLASLCHSKETVIYNNQEKIFKNLFYKSQSSEKEYMFTVFCDEKTHILCGQYRINDKKIKFPLNDLKNKTLGLSENMINFMKNQLRLYAKLSMGRNNTSFIYLKKVFPYAVLIENIFDEGIDLDMRAIFCQLAYTLFIDAHPRNKLAKPNCIRIVKKSEIEKEGERNREMNKSISFANRCKEDFLENLNFFWRGFEI